MTWPAGSTWVGIAALGLSVGIWGGLGVVLAVTLHGGVAW